MGVQRTNEPGRVSSSGGHSAATGSSLRGPSLLESSQGHQGPTWGCSDRQLVPTPLAGDAPSPRPWKPWEITHGYRCLPARPSAEELGPPGARLRPLPRRGLRGPKSWARVHWLDLEVLICPHQSPHQLVPELKRSVGRGPARAQLTLVQASPWQVPGEQVAILLRLQLGQGRPSGGGSHGSSAHRSQAENPPPQEQPGVILQDCRWVSAAEGG